MKILFFGDSVTDAKRNRESNENDRLGTGYVMQIAGRCVWKTLSSMKLLIVDTAGSG